MDQRREKADNVLFSGDTQRTMVMRPDWLVRILHLRDATLASECNKKAGKKRIGTQKQLFTEDLRTNIMMENFLR